jgi:hypothetical protein
MKTKIYIVVAFIFSVPFFAHLQVTNGLVAKYSFNNGTADDEVGTNNGTISGASLTTDRFGNANAAFSFDGIDDHINLGDATEFQMGANDFTISIWLNYADAQQSSVLSKRDGGTTNFSQYNITILADYQFGGVSKNSWSFMRTSTSSDRSISIGDLSNAWHNLTIVHKYSDSTSAFVDGQFIGSSTSPISGDLNVIGRELVLGYSSEMGVNFYNGMLDDLLIYNRAITNSEVNELFNEENPLLASISENINSTFSVYPNPASTEIYIQIDKSATIAISNMLGVEIVNKAIQKSELLDISTFVAGVYFVKNLHSGETIKLIKQ